jgi:hypothetical protein
MLSLVGEETKLTGRLWSSASSPTFELALRQMSSSPEHASSGRKGGAN